MVNEDKDKELLNDEEFEHEPVFVEFEDENQNTIRCEVIDGFEYKDKKWV